MGPRPSVEVMPRVEPAVRDPHSEEVQCFIESDADLARAARDQRAMIWLGHTLHRARQRAGLTQLQVAGRCGISQSELSRVENGLPVKGVTFATLVGLSGALGFDIVFELGTHPVEMQSFDETSERTHLAVREMAR